MFDLLAMLLSSIASFLFPIFASYKALKSSDPAQLTPWLMYWVVFSCAILVESWFSWILFWIPFYGYVRLFFFLYLMLPQTQGARALYEEYIHPFLEDNEAQIDDFIASAHDRLKAAGLAYLRQAIDYVKTNVLGLPPPESTSPTPESAVPQSYTQSLLARFSVPSTRWASPNASTGSGSVDFFNLLAGAVSAATTGGGLSVPGPSNADPAPGSGHLIPPHLRDAGAGERISFIATQRERLSTLLAALDTEQQKIQHEDNNRRAPSMSYDGLAVDEDSSARRLSGWSGLSKSRSEVDFENIEAESGTEDDGSVRRRNVSGGSWVSWAMGSSGKDDGSSARDDGASSSYER